MYDTATRSYTMDDASGSLDWITEGLDPADYQEFSDDEIYEWVDSLIAQSIEAETYELENAVESMNFPRMGYSTTQTFENADEYLAFKRQEIIDDLTAERERMFEFVKGWANESD